MIRFLTDPSGSLDDVDASVAEAVRRMGWDTLQHHAVDTCVPPTPVTRTWERVPSIGVPVVAVSGALDSPDHIGMSHRLADSVPDGRTVDIAGTARYPTLEEPTAFNDAVALVAPPA